MSFLPLIRIWIWVSALATLAGWSLSAVGQLNRGGYLVFGGLAAAAFLLGRRGSGEKRPGTGFKWRKVKARFRRWLPACFLGLTLLIFLGGALYPPSNHTAMTYRTPRVLHWLMEGHWHWIDTPNYRLNNRACGLEWLTAPLLLFTKSDRGLFLVNFIPFLLLPGLVFSLFKRLGVRGRVAWHWMWLLPTGYSFLVQAGGAGNDTFPAVYALAAMDFGLRAWESRRASDLWLSFLSAALLTGAKASNLTLQDLGMKMTAILCGGMLGIYVLGFLTTRGTGRSVAVGLIATLSFTAYMTIVEFMKITPEQFMNWLGCSETVALWLLKPVHIYYVGLFGNIITFIVGYLVSCMFEKKRDLTGLTFWSQLPREEGES